MARSNAYVGLMAAALASASVLPASAAPAPSANVFRTGLYYRALLKPPAVPPAYWFGGTVWVPRVPAERPVAQPAGAVRSVTQWRRVPDAYLDTARAAPPAGPLWVKTDKGFRLDTGPKP